MTCSLAAFVSNHADEIKALFEQVLLVCQEQGLLGNELWQAIDGCKMGADAAKEWFGTFNELGAKRDKLRRLIRYRLQEHRQRDEVTTEPELDQEIREANTILSLDEAKNKNVQGLWQLCCLVHNVQKVANYTSGRSHEETRPKGTGRGRSKQNLKWSCG